MNRTVLAIACLLGLFAAGPVLAQEEPWDWAGEMFDHKSHDFKTVARGAKVEHHFVFENKYVEDVHIASVRSTCRCTTPRILKPTLKTWEKGAIVAEVDTASFVGQKDATLTVVFDKPFYAEVQLHCYTYIRSDVVVQPGIVRFGKVTSGTPAKQKVTIEYAGRKDWKIAKVESNNPHLKATVVETSRRTQRNEYGQQITRVVYELEASLDANAPIGHIRDRLILITNDQQERASRVPVAVEGTVVSAVTVSPSPLLLPAVDPGKSVSKQLVVRSQSPCKVESATCDDPRLKCSVRQVNDTTSLIRVTFTADSKSGKVSETIRIKTDHATDNEISVMVHVRVMSPEPSGAAGE